MYQSSGFSDSENIIIINRTPYFRCTGSTYKEKLKNGLSLPFVFEQEFITIKNETSEKHLTNDSRENVKTNITRFNNHNDDYDNEYQNNFQKKNKKVRSKKGVAKKYKKTCIKNNGYKYKLFVIEENLPDLVSLSNDSSKHCSVTINYNYNNSWLFYDDFDPDWLDYWSYY